MNVLNTLITERPFAYCSSYFLFARAWWLQALCTTLNQVLKIARFCRIHILKMHFLKSIDSSTIVKIPAVTNVNDLNAQSTRKSFCLLLMITKKQFGLNFLFDFLFLSFHCSMYYTQLLSEHCCRALLRYHRVVYHTKYIICIWLIKGHHFMYQNTYTNTYSYFLVDILVFYLPSVLCIYSLFSKCIIWCSQWIALYFLCR